MNLTHLLKTTSCMIFSLVLILIMSACQKDLPVKNPVSQDAEEANSASNLKNSLTLSDLPAPYDLNVVLTGQTPGKFGFERKGLGYIKFRQDPDPAQVISLETWVFNLQPKRAYQLQRAVNPITDNDCSSTVWLTLGKGLEASSIHTNILGVGKADLFRDISAIAKGTAFRIHFQIIDSVTQEIALSSDCYAYTVR